MLMVSKCRRRQGPDEAQPTTVEGSSRRSSDNHAINIALCLLLASTEPIL